MLGTGVPGGKSIMILHHHVLCTPFRVHDVPGSRVKRGSGLVTGSAPFDWPTRTRRITMTNAPSTPGGIEVPLPRSISFETPFSRGFLFHLPEVGPRRRSPEKPQVWRNLLGIGVAV